MESEAVTNFRTYLRIPSVQPNVDYGPCLEFLKGQAKSLDLPCRIFEVVAKKPIVVISWEGKEPKLPSVLLNSHMDVVPVYPEKWTHDPFSADKDANGNIYARGSQDMKCVGIQYIEAVRRLKFSGIKLKRTLHLSFVPDEEIGGADGMKKFVHTNDFKKLNIGFSLDEGMASPTEEFVLYNGERSIWQVLKAVKIEEATLKSIEEWYSLLEVMMPKNSTTHEESTKKASFNYYMCGYMCIHCPGTPGHGSLMHPSTAGEKLRIIIDRFMDFRQKEKEKLEANPNLTVGDVTTINLTQIKGGVQPNVVPPELQVIFDARLAVTIDHKEFLAMIESWCNEAGPGTHLTFIQRNAKVPVTPLDESNPWWVAFKRASDAMNLKIRTLVFPGGTDSRYVREVGIPAIGFSPINKTPILLHDHDEFLNETIFLKGIDIYEKLIPAVADI